MIDKVRQNVSWTSLHLLLVILSVFGQLDVAAETQNGTPILSLHLETDRSTYVVGEPVDLIAILRNDGEKRAQSGYGFDVTASVLPFLISDDGINYKKYRGIGWGIRYMGIGRPLAAKSERGQYIRILYNTAGGSGGDAYMAFPRKGTFYLKAAMRVRDVDGGLLNSNIVELTILDPEGEDKNIWNKFRSKRGVYFLHKRTSDDDEASEYFATLLERNPSSVYAKYLNADEVHQDGSRIKNNSIGNNWINIDKYLQNHPDRKALLGEH